MITSIQFREFRVLEQAMLPLGRFNLLLGPNGSGKTTALRALLAAGDAARARRSAQPAPVLPDLATATAEFTIALGEDKSSARLHFDSTGSANLECDDRLTEWLSRVSGYVLEPAALAQRSPSALPPRLAANGAGLPTLLAAIARQNPRGWEALLGETRRLLPEFEDIAAGETVNGQLGFSVRTRQGLVLHPENLSQGSLVVLALLGLVFGPERPSLIAFEELERGIHPRLLRDIRDLLYRLAFPEDVGDVVAPAQLLVTTHSPYVLDLFADVPEDVIIAAKDEGRATFRRLADIPELHDMLQEGRLGELWYSGILGGVP